MSRTMRFSSLLAFLLLAACATQPTGPSQLVLPGTGAGFAQFQSDDNVCRQYAFAQIGGVSPNQAAMASGAGSAALGAALGAAAGAAMGGGEGAAWGAGAGLLTGAMMGTSTASSSGYAAQQHYDNAYIQCMYAKGHRVPVAGQFANPYPTRNPYANTPAPAQRNPPPPPPGTPPPPPPR